MNKSESSMIKGIAILMMLFHHLFYKEARYAKYMFSGLLFGQEGTIQIAKNFKLCVALFALVTGFGMMMVEKKLRSRRREEVSLASDLGRMYKKALSRYLDLFKTLTYVMAFGLIVTYAIGAKKTLGSVYGDPVHIVKGVIANITGTASFFGIEWFNSSWWYAYVAATFIFIFPILYYMAKKLKVFTVLIIALLLNVVFMVMGVSVPYIIEYTPCMVLGMVFAEYDLPDRMTEWVGDSMAKRVGLILASVVAYGFFSWVRVVRPANFIWFIFMVSAVVIWVKLALCKIPVVNKGLAIFGDHSRYMWLVHTFVYSHWFFKPLFSIRFIPLIYIAVVVVVFVISWILEWLMDRMTSGIKKLKHS